MQLGQEPGPRVSPPGIRGPGGDAEHLRGLLEGQAAELAQLHQLGRLGIGGRKPGQGLVEGQQFVGHFRGGEPLGIKVQQMRVIAAVFEAFLAAGVLDEDAVHGLGRRREEMAATVPGPWLLGVDQAQVGFVDQGRCLQRLTGLLLSQRCAARRRSSS